jgi:small redox-active disulfide protein 2
MNIKVLGTGCAKCAELQDVVERAIAQTGMDATVTKVEDMQAIMRYGVMSTPALVIDERVVSSGRVPDVAQIGSWLTSAAAEAGKPA